MTFEAALIVTPLDSSISKSWLLGSLKGKSITMNARIAYRFSKAQSVKF
jgi:hypothetical protein